MTYWTWKEYCWKWPDSLMARFFQKWRQRIMLSSFRTCISFAWKCNTVLQMSRFRCQKMKRRYLQKNKCPVFGGRYISWIVRHEEDCQCVVQDCGKVAELTCQYSLGFLCVSLITFVSLDAKCFWNWGALSYVVQIVGGEKKHVAICGLQISVSDTLVLHVFKRS